MRSREAKLQKKKGELCGGKVIFCSCFHSPPPPPSGAFAESGPKKKKRERERPWAKKKKRERERDSEICLSQASTSVEGRKEEPKSEILVVTECWSDKTENMRESQMRNWVEKGKKAKPELLKSRIEIQKSHSFRRQKIRVQNLLKERRTLLSTASS